MGEKHSVCRLYAELHIGWMEMYSCVVAIRAVSLRLVLPRGSLEVRFGCT